MYADRLDLLRSPCCHVGLTLHAPMAKFGEVWGGRLVCARCGADYAIRRGMPHLYVEDARWLPKAREAAGWVAFHKQRGLGGEGNHALVKALEQLAGREVGGVGSRQ